MEVRYSLSLLQPIKFPNHLLNFLLNIELKIPNNNLIKKFIQKVNFALFYVYANEKVRI